MSFKRAIVIALASALLLVAGCGNTAKSDTVSLKKYVIWENPDTETHTETVDLLQSLAKEKYDISIKNGDGSEERQILFITDEAIAQEYGQSLAALSEKGFCISHTGGSLLIFSPSNTGLQRAVTYLTYRLTDESGNLLLADGTQYADTGANTKDAVMVGNSPISEYEIICQNKNQLSAAEELRFYIQQSCGVLLPICNTEKAGSNLTISLITDETLTNDTPQITISGGLISITGKDESVLSDGVQLFADTYLGWIKAGTDEAHLSTTSSSAAIPADLRQGEAWIPEREAIITLWNINYSRGVFLNNNTSLKNDIMSFSEDQLYEYVKMLKFCGFTGIQVTDMCSAWAGAGGYEYVHERIRILADAAHSLDMNFTLWVWGSEFTGYGWVDDSVTYEILEGTDFVYENPDAVAAFEKYYSIYAELADCCDRLIIHYYDPGNLTKAEDIAFFASMLRDKFYSINPNVDFGISCWVDVYDKNAFVQALGNDITLYECGYRDNPDQTYYAFRGFTANTGCRLGTWAWNTCEMEIDQMAQLNFNLDIIKSVYQTARQYDSVMKPGYWSEMDSYHVLNVFSLYCGGQLLINPDMDSEELLQEVALYAVGEEYAADFAEILLLIQDARSGSSWDTYWWSSPSYILKSDAYPAQDILNRCNTYIPVMEEMIAKELDTNTIPYPISLTEVLQLMLPHLEQIRDYAEFRIALDELEAEYAAGTSPDILQEKLNEIATPVSEYNCIIGLWGQIEARAQQEMVYAFCQETGLTKPIYPHFDQDRKFRIYSQLLTYQKGQDEPVVTLYPYFQYAIAYGVPDTERLVKEMIADGLLIETENRGVYLSDWENYKYQFN